MKSILLVLIFYVFISTICTTMAMCQTIDLKNLIVGSWYFNYDNSFFSVDPYYDQAIEITKIKELIFSLEQVEIKSGIYRMTGEEGWPEGHYPWIYCGSYTFYKIDNDSLIFYNPAYKNWEAFHVTVNADKKSLTLENIKKKIVLVRTKDIEYDNKIKSIHLEVHDVNFFGCKVLVNDSLISATGTNVKDRFYSKMYSKYIFNSFKTINIKNLDKTYISNSSENRILELDIEYNEGKKKHIKIIGRDYPDELKFALLPIIYVADFINHKEYWSGIIK